MEIILLERVGRLGNLGDKVTVKDGYARNFLLPKGKALRATKANIEAYEARKAEIAKQNEDKKAAAQKLAADVDGVKIIIIRQAGEDGRLFGSVSVRDIATAIAEKKQGVTHQMVILNQAIKDAGVYNVTVQLHPEVQVKVKLAVARSEAEGRDALSGKNITDKRSASNEPREEAIAEAAAPEGDDQQAA